MSRLWVNHIDNMSRDDLTKHLRELIDDANRLDHVGNMDQLNHQRGKVEGFRYLLSLVQSAK